LTRALATTLLVVATAACSSEPTTPYGRARVLGLRLQGNVQAHRISCEARSAADLAAAHGLSVDEHDVLDRLPRSDDPDLGFVGDPDDPAGRLPPEGYGVHAGPIASTLRALGLDARAEHGRDLEWLARETEAGRPVIAWVTGSFSSGTPRTMTSSAGRTFTAVRGEHTVLVLCVRGGDVMVLDPAGGRLAEVDAATFLRSWELLGRSAVSARGPLAPAGGVAPTPR
jgi:uncharacterized protein YvpB